MSAPVLTASLWNPTTNILALDWDQAVSYTGAANGIQLTDAAGVLWSNTGAPGTTNDVAGIQYYTLARYPAGTPGTVSTFDVAATTATNGSSAANLAITDSAVVLAVNHVSPFSANDIGALDSYASLVYQGGSFTSAGFSQLQADDYDALRANLTGTTLSLAPRLATQARALIAAADTYLASTKDNFSTQDFVAALKALKAAMPNTGQAFPFAITSNGL